MRLLGHLVGIPPGFGHVHMEEQTEETLWRCSGIPHEELVEVAKDRTD